MKKKNIIIFICCLLIITGALVVLLKKEVLFGNKKEEKIKEEPKQEEKNTFSYTPIMYKICDSDNCNYLVGAMHLGDGRITMLSDKVLNAYKEMDSVSAELDDIPDSVDINQFMLPNDETIESIISNEMKEKLIDFGNKHQFFVYDQYKKFKIGFLADLISSIAYIELGYTTKGVDSYFISLANKDKKGVVGIEKLEDQMAFLTDYSDKLYMYQIEKTIDIYDEVKKEITELYTAYLEGNIEKLNELINSDEEIPNDIDEDLKNEFKKYNEAILDNRNIVMANAIEDYLLNNKNVFVVVGAAHVIGDGGIVSILNDKGYEITSMNEA